MKRRRLSFKPEIAEKILAGIRTETRRRIYRPLSLTESSTVYVSGQARRPDWGQRTIHTSHSRGLQQVSHARRPVYPAQSMFCQVSCELGLPSLVLTVPPFEAGGVKSPNLSIVVCQQVARARGLPNMAQKKTTIQVTKETAAQLRALGAGNPVRDDHITDR